MPTIWEHGPYRFFFYSGDRDEPPHVHVERETNKAKFWLDPVRLQNSDGYNRSEINRIQRLIEENQKMLLEKWHDYFSDGTPKFKTFEVLFMSLRIIVLVIIVVIRTIL
jgi:hypothetical protein